MKNSIKYVAVVCLLAFIFTGCKKSTPAPDPIIPDTTIPTISITKPIANDVFHPGTPIIFKATFSDNVKLGSYNIEISKKPLTGGFILKSVPDPLPWSYTKGSTSFSSTEKQQVIDLSDINIPLLMGTSAVETGDYNFKVTCVDAAGNVAIAVTNVIKIN